MGIRVEFRRGAHDGILSPFLGSSLEGFLTWYTEEAAEDPECYPPDLWPRIEQVVEHNSAALVINSAEEAKRYEFLKRSAN